jgi:hypothetical protein
LCKPAPIILAAEAQTPLTDNVIAPLLNGPECFASDNILFARPQEIDIKSMNGHKTSPAETQ